MPLIERLAGELGALVSVDTYKPAVAEAAIAAGAAIVNDVSGLRDPALAAVCARTGAALVLMHTRAAPKQTLLTPSSTTTSSPTSSAFLRERMEAARARGHARRAAHRSTPAPTSPRRPAQTVAVLARLEALHALGRPLLLAVSRKDFVGALTAARRASGSPGTLAALGARRRRRRARPARPRRRATPPTSSPSGRRCAARPCADRRAAALDDAIRHAR